MCRRLSILLILILVIIFTSIDIKSYELNAEKYINVEVKGEVEEEKVVKLELGSTFSDLLAKITLKNTADIEDISLLEVLYNNQIIVINKKINSDLISINSASVEQLCNLPGIGYSTALKIIEYRNNFGSFIKLDDLKNVSGIGEKKYSKIKQYICL